MSREADPTLRELAGWVGGEVVGDPERRISAVRPLETAGPDDLAPFTDSRYREQVDASRAGALLVGKARPEIERDQVVCSDTRWALAVFLERMVPSRPPEAGVHPTAVVDPSARVDPAATVGPLVTVGRDVEIGSGVVLQAGVAVGDRCRIGAGSILHPRVVLYPDTELGREVVVHAGAVLGSDGFGYVPRDGRLVKVPQIGCLVLEDGVEVGANTTIDRGALHETRIGAGSKLDNLVQVGHNARLGESCVICGQAGIAGSSRLGRGVVLGGQVGVIDHVQLGDGVQVAAASAVLGSVDAGETVGGTPAVPLGAWRRLALLLPRLPELFRRVRALEREHGEIETQRTSED